MVVIKVIKQTLKAIAMPADNKYRNGNIENHFTTTTIKTTRKKRQ